MRAVLGCRCPTNGPCRRSLAYKGPCVECSSPSSRRVVSTRAATLNDANDETSDDAQGRTYSDGRFVAFAGLLECGQVLVRDVVALFVGHGALVLLRADWVTTAEREGGSLVVLSEVLVSRASGR